MIEEAAFWDTSALVPLCILDDSSGRIALLAKQVHPVVWWLTPVEIHSAVARQHRLGQLNDGEKVAAMDRLDRLRQQWNQMAAEESVRDLAQSLLYSHPLRAADSLQLAAALVWCREKPAGRKFIASDLRLGAAATQVGFIVIRP